VEPAGESPRKPLTKLSTRATRFSARLPNSVRKSRRPTISQPAGSFAARRETGNRAGSIRHTPDAARLPTRPQRKWRFPQTEEAGKTFLCPCLEPRNKKGPLVVTPNGPGGGRRWGRTTSAGKTIGVLIGRLDRSSENGHRRSLAVRPPCLARWPATAARLGGGFDSHRVIW
jgi:hypothetical protein